jgi:autotransporter-associated beta strand protein
LAGGISFIGSGVGAIFTVDVVGGTLRGDSFVLGSLTGLATATNIAAGATIDFAGCRRRDRAQSSVGRRHRHRRPLAARSRRRPVKSALSPARRTQASRRARTPRCWPIPACSSSQAPSSYSGGTTIETGATLQLGAGGTPGSILGNVANSGTLAFNRSNAVQFDGVISGNGVLQKDGAGALNLTANSSYTGNTNVNAGLLAVNGSIASSALTTVNAGATLGGNGTVGNTTINGGTLAPGNSIGSLTVQGNLVFTAASSYMVEISPSNADRTNVTGTATLGGATVNASFAAGTYVAKQYTILNATGGVSGTFNGPVNTNLPGGFKSSLSYDANNAYLNLALVFVPPPGGGLSANQQNVGNAIVNFFNTTGGIPIVFGGLTPTGLTQISGETATGSQQTTFNAMNQFMGVMTDPFIRRTRRSDQRRRQSKCYAEEGSLAYAAKRKPNDALAAIYTKAPPIVTELRAAVERVGGWVRRFAAYRWQHDRRIERHTQQPRGRRGWCLTTASRRTRWPVFALAGGGTNFSVNGFGSGRSDLFQAGAFIGTMSVRRI